MFNFWWSSNKTKQIDKFCRTIYFSSVWMILKETHDFTFLQDGAPSHTSNKTQAWCRNNFQRFWGKEKNCGLLHPPISTQWTSVFGPYWGWVSLLHGGTLFHEGSLLQEGTLLNGVTFARVSLLHGESLLHEGTLLHEWKLLHGESFARA